jgi:hypothetical protein
MIIFRGHAITARTDYSGLVFQLGILQEYDYFLKVDTDIHFNGTIPFNMLHGMKIQDALFGHTAEFKKGFRACTKGLKLARYAFEEMARDVDRRPAWAKQINFTGPCSAKVQKFERGVDKYYTNLIIMETKFWQSEFWQSEPVRHLGNFINEWYPGFFRYRWGDQIFFQLAMGMFNGPDFRDYVTDYTEVRCTHRADCWFPWGKNAKNRTYCQSGGYFHHGKFNSEWKRPHIYPNVTAVRRGAPFKNKYVQKC